VLYNLVGSCPDNQCTVVFLGIVKNCVEEVDFAALRFFVLRCVTRPEEWMAVVSVNVLATVVAFSDSLAVLCTECQGSCGLLNPTREKYQGFKHS